MSVRREIILPFPLAGVFNLPNRTAQPPLTAREARNVWAVDRLRVARGAQRIGTVALWGVPDNGSSGSGSGSGSSSGSSSSSGSPLVCPSCNGFVPPSFTASVSGWSGPAFACVFDGSVSFKMVITGNINRTFTPLTVKLDQFGNPCTWEQIIPVTGFTLTTYAFGDTSCATPILTAVSFRVTMNAQSRKLFVLAVMSNGTELGLYESTSTDWQDNTHAGNCNTTINFTGNNEADFGDIGHFGFHAWSGNAVATP